MRITANWCDRLGIWFATRGLERDVATPKYWNGFGEMLPGKNATVSITCEINFPKQGIRRQIEGAIARGEDGRLHIVHRGGIGGGRKGIGRHSFFTHFLGASVTAWDGDRECQAALVADLESSRMPAQLAHFVKDVQRIKDLVVQRNDRAHVNQKLSTMLGPFREEPESRAGYEVQGSRQPSADHGLVANALAEALSRLGHKLGKDAYRDLVVVADGLLRVLFEVKSGARLTDLYQAIGQLFFHSVEEKKRPVLVLVSPPLRKVALRRIRRLGIRHLSYTFNRDSRVTFEGLARFFRSA